MATVEFKGLDNILDRIDSIGDPDKLKKAMLKACLLVETDAKKKAPKGTGELRRSIENHVEQKGTDIIGVVYTPLEYAPYVEFGTGLFAEEEGRKDVPWHYQDEKGEWHSTSGMKPHPYLRPALEENRENIKRILKEGLKDD